MMRASARRVAATIPLACVLLSGCTVRFDAEEQLGREEKRFKVSGPPDVRVATFDGSIELRSWDRDEILVEIEKRGMDEQALQSIEVRAEQQGDRIEVDVRRPSRGDRFVGIGIHMSPRARLLVTVPRRVTLLHARSGDGSIRADRIEGRVELRTRDGRVRAEEIKGQLDVDTADGSIAINDVDGDLVLVTRDGGISVSGRLAALRAKTGDGSITVRADPDSPAGSDWSISTGDGGVVLYLPRSFNAELDAETRDGRIRSDFEVGDAREDGRRRRSVRGRIGDGGSVVRIRTGDGSIHLRHN
jgi:DUF4097 and DUF4098 domain-containing protein YvlB